MRLTIVGSGDAFGSGGRFHTCFQVENAGATFLIDCGATSMTALNVRGLDPNRIDAVVISHLHGDHFGGLPFLLIEAQHQSVRSRPLVIAGPPGTRARLDAALELLFPGATATRWRFAWEVVEMVPGDPHDLLGHRVATTEVSHPSGAPATAVRLWPRAAGPQANGQSGGLAYSGDTEWTDALLGVADGAALFIVECSSYAEDIPRHLSWATLKPRLSELRAQRVMITHMNAEVLAHRDEIRAAGVLVADDGAVIEL